MISSQYVGITTIGHGLSTDEPVTRPIVNTYCFRRPSGLFAPNKVNVVSAFVAAVATDLQAVLSVSYVTDWVDARFIDDPLDPILRTVLAKNGTTAGDSLPSSSFVNCILKTGVRGRSWQGAKRYGLIAEGDTLRDVLTSAAVTKWDTFKAAFLAGFTDADGNLWTPYVVSQKNSTFNPTTANVQGYPCVDMAVNPVVGIMKRRRQPMS